MLKTNVASLLRELRGYKNMTQGMLAKKSGVSTKRISFIENGKSEITVDELFALDKALDCDLVWGLIEERDSNDGRESGSSNA